MQNEPKQNEAMQIDIQLAESRNIEEIVGIVRQTAKWLKTKGIQQWSENYPICRLEEELLNAELFVVRDRFNKTIGTLSLSKAMSEFWPDDRSQKSSTSIYLHRVAVSREYSGLNLGNEIITWAINYCKKQDIGLLQLECDKSNPFLPDFYRICGFECVGESFYSPWKMTFLLFEMKLKVATDF